MEISVEWRERWSLKGDNEGRISARSSTEGNVRHPERTPIIATGPPLPRCLVSQLRLGMGVLTYYLTGVLHVLHAQQLRSISVGTSFGFLGTFAIGPPKK